jgi:hypothetical protein
MSGKRTSSRVPIHKLPRRIERLPVDDAIAWVLEATQLTLYQVLTGPHLVRGNSSPPSGERGGRHAGGEARSSRLLRALVARVRTWLDRLISIVGHGGRQTRSCSGCGRQIPERALKCGYCGTWTHVGRRVARPTHHERRGGLDARVCCLSGLSRARWIGDPKTYL